MSANQTNPSREREMAVLSGWLMLPINILLILGGPTLLIFSIVLGERSVDRHPVVWMLVLSIFVIIGAVLMLIGFFTLQPNEARVLILFGAYKGTVKTSGFHWANPFYSNGRASGSGQTKSALKAGATAESGVVAGLAHKQLSRNRISLRARNLNGDRLKVNDKRGNPVEIAVVVVWRVRDTAQAMFDVEDYENYVRVQSESALRHLASRYAYDHGEEHELTLRSGVEEVSQDLQRELQDRLAKAGVQVDEARLTHLAYAPEIAQVMLRRQQAEAVIAARTKIVHGAVSMVDMALKELAEKEVVQLDNERKASMISNLMVVLCSESGVHPVVNTGTLYT